MQRNVPAATTGTLRNRSLFCQTVGKEKGARRPPEVLILIFIDEEI